MTRTTMLESTLHGDEAVTFVAGIATLDAILEASNNVVHGALDPPSPDSPMGLAYKAGRRDPYEQARLLLASAEDHLGTVLMLLQNNVLPIFALYSLLRPAAEADVRIAYLIDGSIDETRRLARGLNVRLESLIEQTRLTLDAALLASRVAALEAKATANAIAVRRDKQDRAVAFDEPRQKEVDLFRTYLKEGEMVYRYLCGHVHSMPWVMLNRDKATPTSEPGISQVPLGLDTTTFVAILALVLGLHERNLVDLLDRAGYPVFVWTKAKESAMTKARLRYTKLLGGQQGADSNTAAR